MLQWTLWDFRQFLLFCTKQIKLCYIRPGKIQAMKNNNLCILHIEDDQVDQMVVKRFLNKMSVISTIHHAANGAEALDLLRGENGKTKLDPMPDVVLADINMPLINGIEFLQEIRKDEHLRHLMVFMITTSSDTDDIRNAYNQNIAGYIIKPVDLNEFEKLFKTLEDYFKICVFPA